MKLKEILSISGRQGLYKLKTKTRGGVIATSLVDGKRVITTINQKISFLSEIQVYCIGNEINLSKVFEKMLLFESGKISRVVPKANSLGLETYFLKIIDFQSFSTFYLAFSQNFRLLMCSPLIFSLSSDGPKKVVSR